MYICKNKNIYMKTFNFLFIAATALSLASCGGSEEAQVEKSTYSLDTKVSNLKWKGSKSADYFHTGSVKFTEGSIEMEGDSITGGTFTIDMNSIVAEDATLPDAKKEYLAGHLKDTAFFFIAEHPNTMVTINGYQNGELSTIITVLGQEVKQNIPVTIKNDDKTVTIKGKFDIDFATLKMEGMEPDPETGEKILSVISYELDLTLNKK